MVEQLDISNISEQLMKSCIVNREIMSLDEIENMGFQEFGIRSKLNMPLKLYKYFSNIDIKNQDRMPIRADNPWFKDVDMKG